MEIFCRWVCHIRNHIRTFRRIVSTFASLFLIPIVSITVHLHIPCLVPRIIRVDTSYYTHCFYNIKFLTAPCLYLLAAFHYFLHYRAVGKPESGRHGSERSLHPCLIISIVGLVLYRSNRPTGKAVFIARLTIKTFSWRQNSIDYAQTSFLDAHVFSLECCRRTTVSPVRTFRMPFSGI